MNLKLLRKQMNKTQEEIAKELNVTQQTYARYELGTSEPTIESLIKLADYYQVSLDYLCEHKTQGIQLGYLTEEKKQAIYLLLELNEINFISAYSFMQGLKIKQN
ncbi:MAG: helix-turn-helix transcriptional regulator [Clostridia bacterium]|nr:helix-turn-helix transcriptional regulator [Clostridia bacterium]